MKLFKVAYIEIEKLVLLLVGGVIGFIASIAKDYFVEKTKKKIKENELKRNKTWRVVYGSS